MQTGLPWRNTPLSAGCQLCGVQSPLIGAFTLWADGGQRDVCGTCYGLLMAETRYASSYITLLTLRRRSRLVPADVLAWAEAEWEAAGRPIWDWRPERKWASLIPPSIYGAPPMPQLRRA